MMRTFLTSLFATLLMITASDGQPKPGKARPIESPTQSGKPESVVEFQGDDISVAVRSLARRAKLNIVVGDQVRGTVTARIENKTPREAIEIIAQSKDLILDEKDGILYLRPRNPRPPNEPEAPTPEQSLEDAFTQVLTPALTKLYDTFLDYHARPEIAQKVAKAKKLLYDALIAEGFTKDEAFRLVLADQGIPIPNLNQ